MEIIINIGLPASGKSAYTNNFLKLHSDYVKVSRDDFRYMLRNEKLCNFEIEKIITELHLYTIKTAIENKLNVIVDDTNVNLYFLNILIKDLRKIASIKFNVFYVDAETCIDRDNLRERKVGEDVIRQMDKEFNKLKNNFLFNPINDIDNIM